jgi:putative transposase
VLPSDLAFSHALSMEADEGVASYEIEPERVVAYTAEHGYAGSVPDAIAKSRTGQFTFVEVKYSASTTEERSALQAEVQRKAASAVGANWSWFTELDALAQERLIHDWLQINATLEETKWKLQTVWSSLSRDVMGAVRSGGETTLEGIQSLALDSWSLVFSTIFRLVHLGLLHTDLRSKPLGPQTRVSISEVTTEPGRLSMVVPSPTPQPELLDYRSWPGVDEASLSPEDRERFLRLKSAIEAKCDGRRTSYIQKKWAVSRSSLSYFTRRCTAIAEDGRLSGYRALVLGFRQKAYSRNKEVRPSADGRGMAGAFDFLLARHEEVADWLHGELSPRAGKTIEEAGLNVLALHGKFLKKLREDGVRPDEYPFCTERLGYDALSAYVREAIAQNGATARKRYGKHSEDALATLSGRKGVLRPLVCLERAAYDEYQIPDIATLVIVDDDGQERDIPLSRVWFCPVVDFKSTAVLSYSVAHSVRYGAMELLEAFESAVAPKPRPKSNLFDGLPTLPGEGLPGLVMPHVRGRRIASLVVDNDLAHGANAVIGHMREKTGVAISFGKVHSWIQRYVVEGLFSELQVELSRLPSTTGAGPLDPKVGDAVKTAVKLRFRMEHLLELLDKLVARRNARPRLSLMMRTPNEQLAFDCAPSRRLAIVPSYDDALLNGPWIAVEIVIATVRGSVAKGAPPYIQIDGTYTSDRLRQDWNMIGQQLRVLMPRDSRKIKAFRLDGTEYDFLWLRGSFARTAHDRATRKEIKRLYRHGELREHGPDPVTHYQQQVAHTALVKSNVKRPKISREANILAATAAISQPAGGPFRLSNKDDFGNSTSVKPRGRARFFGGSNNGDSNTSH